MGSDIGAGFDGNDSKNSGIRDSASLEYLRPLRLIYALNILIATLLQDVFEGKQCELSSMNKEKNRDMESSPEDESSAKETSNAESSTEISDILEMLTETSESLHVFKTYLRWPSEETFKAVKLLFDRGKGKSFFTREKMDKFFLFLESEDSDQESLYSTSSSYTSSSDDDQEGIFGRASGSLSEGTSHVKEKENRSRRFRKKRAKPDIKDRNNPEDDSAVRAMKEHLKWKNVKIFHLQRKITSLKMEKISLLADLGEMNFTEKKKELEERNSSTFRRVFLSSLPKTKKFSISPKPSDNNYSVGYPNDHQTSFEKSDVVTGNIFTSIRSPNTPFKPETAKESLKSLQDNNTDFVLTNTLRGKNHQPGGKKMGAGVENERGSQDSTMQKVLRVNLEEQATGGESSKSVREESKMNTGTSSKGENNSIRESKVMQAKSNPTSNILGKASGKCSEAGKSNDPLTSATTFETDDQDPDREIVVSVSFSVQQDDANAKEYISLASKPPISVATTLYTNYKRLLIILAQSLLSSEVIELKNWASEKFSIENAQNATDVFFQLDEKKVINAENLSQLCDFFKSIVRYDLVHIIEAFLLGDYSLFSLIPSSKNRDPSRVRNSQLGRISRYGDLFSGDSSRRSSVSSTASIETVRNPAISGKPQNNNEPPSSVTHQIQQAASSSFSVLPNPSQPGKLFSRTPNENQSTARVHQDLTPTATGLPFPTVNKMVVVDGSTVSQERRTMAANVSTRTSQSTTNSLRNTQSVGSNGLKHSKFQRPNAVSNSRAPGNSPNLEAFNQDDNWLCSHYKRHCFVKFECCDKFWPCHRCHNNQSTCGRKKLKSRDTKMLKCVYCNKQQQFGQFCCDCGAKFSNYFCGLCKHLTGHDDFPYHCEKCGICRIHGDRSFHCDVCGVCLDVQLQGNHKCREGSAHDECCICLEDAFTGCQILPCSHKVHKECATQMIRSGITRCPICRESFAHKLERRPTTNSKKYARK